MEIITGVSGYFLGCLTTASLLYIMMKLKGEI